MTVSAQEAQHSGLAGGGAEAGAGNGAGGAPAPIFKQHTGEEALFHALVDTVYGAVGLSEERPLPPRGAGRPATGPAKQQSATSQAPLLAHAPLLSSFLCRRSATPLCTVPEQQRASHEGGGAHLRLHELPEDVLQLVLGHLVGPKPQAASIPSPSTAPSVAYQALLGSSGLLRQGPSVPSGAAAAAVGGANAPNHHPYPHAAAPVLPGGAVLPAAAAVVNRKISNVTGIPTDPGLLDAARLGMTSRSMRAAYLRMLEGRPDLAVQVGLNTRALAEKRRLVRRLTITHHDQYMKREMACELGGGVFLIGCLSLSCAAWPGLCGGMAGLLNFVVFTLTHMLTHTVVLAAAYRTAGQLGVRRALLAGMMLIVGYYCGVVPLIQALAGISQVPPALNLEPWDRAVMQQQHHLGGPAAATGTGSSGEGSAASCPADHGLSLFSMAGLHLQGPWHGQEQGAQGAECSTGVGASGSSSSSTQTGHAGSLGHHPARGASSPQAMSQPFYPLAVLLWPLFGTGMRWRALHVLSNCFAWCYGVYEFRASYGYVKSRNGL